MNLAKDQKKLLLVLGLLLVATIVALLFWLSGDSPAKPKEGPTQTEPGFFSIGVLAPLSGDLALHGASIEHGAKIAAKVINENGGILGKPVKLHVLDTRSQPQLTKDLARELIERGKVSLIVGTADSDSAIQAAEIADQLKIPFIYSANGPVKTCSRFDKKTVSDYVWGSGMTDKMRVEPLLLFLASKTQKPQENLRIYYFSTNDPSSTKRTEYVISTAESLTFETIARDYVDPRIRDYFQRIRTIFRKFPDLLLVTTSEQGAKRFIPQASKLGVGTEMLMAGLDTFQEERIRSFGDVTDGIHTVSRYAYSLENPENKEFLAAWQAMFPNSNPTALAAAGTYGPLQIARKAFEKAKSSDALRFRDAMKDLELSLPQGNVLVNDQNHLFVQPLYAVELKQGRFKVLEHLGDLSHPSLEGCVIPQVEKLDQE